MKRFIFLCSLFFIFSVSTVFAALPQFSVPSIRFAYIKADKNIQKGLASVSPSFSAEQSRLIEGKRSALLVSFQSLDQSVAIKNKQEARRHIASIKSNLTEIIALIKKQKQWTPSTATAQVATVSPSSQANPSHPIGVVYYADMFEGRGTSNGNRFSHAFYSSAKCETPFNTLIQVVSKNKSIIVKNNDRPNCEKNPDIIDLTKTAFSSLAPLSKWRIDGEYVTLGVADKNYYKKYLEGEFFSSLHISLDEKIPNSYLRNDTIHIGGRVTDGKPDTIFFLRTPSGKDVSMSLRVENGRFDYYYPVEETGVYKLVVASGMSFATSDFAEITVHDPSVFAGKKLFSPSETPKKLQELNFERVEFSDLRAINLLKFPTRDYYKMSISQDGKTLEFGGIGAIAFRTTALDGFDRSRDMRVMITVSPTISGFSHDTYTQPVSVYETTMKGAVSHKTDKKENISISVAGNILTVRAFASKDVNIKPAIYLITPDGSVIKSSFDASSIDSNGFLKKGIVATKDIELSTSGQYLVEVNYDNGFAAFNGSISYGNVLPLFKSDYDGIDATLTPDTSNVSNSTLSTINSIRKNIGKNTLVLDQKLIAVAQAKAEDMANNDYLSHVDSKGEHIDGTAKRIGNPITGRMGENIAGGNVHYRVLLVGLAYSGGHRENMLGDWKKLWVAAVIKNGKVYYVQVFSE